MTSWLLALALVASLLATVTDLRTRTIPNWLTFPLVPLASALHLLQSGLEGLLFASLGALVCFAPVYFLFARGALGGGDVKLFAGLGALLGARDGLELELSAFCMVSLFAIVLTAWRGRLWVLVRASLRATLHLVAPQRHARPAEPDAGLELPMALAIFVATLAHAFRGLA